MKEITSKQRETLRAIVEQTKQRGFPPTNRELAPILGLGDHAGVRQRLDTLRRYGLVMFDGSPRSIRVTREGLTVLQTSECKAE